MIKKLSELFSRYNLQIYIIILGIMMVIQLFQYTSQSRRN